MHSTAITVIATTLVLLIVSALIGAATDFARRWVRDIARKELEKVIRNAIREVSGDA